MAAQMATEMVLLSLDTFSPALGPHAHRKVLLGCNEICERGVYHSPCWRKVNSKSSCAVLLQVGTSELKGTGQFCQTDLSSTFLLQSPISPQLMRALHMQVPSS